MTHLYEFTAGKAMAEGSQTPSTNNSQRAQRVLRADAGPSPSDYIAAIDFGTVNCSVAYTAPGEMGEHGPVLLPFDTFYRIPTAILFNPDGEVEAFGANARIVYRGLSGGEQLKYAFFEQFKMELQQDQSVNREMKVKARNGKEYYVVEIIAHILKFLKDELIRVLQSSGVAVEATDFDWVITVPAIWKSKGKQMMREAGYKAGLCSMECCPDLREACTHTPSRIEEVRPDKLSLALEPESAAIFCQYKSETKSFHSNKDDDEDDDDNNKEESSYSYLVVDIGGGTVDISAHCLVRDPEPHIEVIFEPTGNNCGGTKINKEFMKYLEDLVEDPGFSRFISTSDPVKNSKHWCILGELMNEKFEEQKKLFGEYFKKKYIGSLDLSPLFCKTYKDLSPQKSESIIDFEDQELRISHELMSTLFEKTSNGIIACIDSTLENVDNIQKIYLVGGFGGSKYIKHLVTEKYKGRGIECVVPVEHSYAVARGAALFKLRPSVIKVRKVDATYGLSGHIPFKQGLHDPKYKWTNDDNELRCENIFCTIVEKGEIVGAGEEFSMTFTPALHNQQGMILTFYSSQGTDVFYVTGEWGKGKCEPRHTVTKIGEIFVEMPIPDGDKKRSVEITFSFSHTEIKVRALDKTSNKDVKTVLDFLTT